MYGYIHADLLSIILDFTSYTTLNTYFKIPIQSNVITGNNDKKSKI